MCYNGCTHESFNPVTGDSTCHRGKQLCPEELEYCENCREMISQEEYFNSLEGTGQQNVLCSECFLEWQENNEESNAVCPYCETEWYTSESDFSECPNCKRHVKL